MYVKAKIDKTLQYSKCRSGSGKDEMNNRIIIECSKLAQKDGQVDPLRIMQAIEV